MTTEVLKKKTSRYLSGDSVPAERKQIQNWLSCTGEHKTAVSAQERKTIEDAIVGDVKAYIEYTQIVPGKEPSWWKRITAIF